MQLQLLIDGYDHGPLFAPVVKQRPLVRPKGKEGVVHRAQQKQRTPVWSDLAACKRFYTEAARRTRETGELHVVDHIVPKCGATVSRCHSMPRRHNVYRCPECRTPRKSYELFVKHCLTCPRSTCTCGGYPYKHRPGSPCCEQNPLSILYQADRAGATTEQLLELAADIAFDDCGTNTTTKCPF